MSNALTSARRTVEYIKAQDRLIAKQAKELAQLRAKLTALRHDGQKD